MTPRQKDDGWALLVTAVVSASLSSICTVLTFRWLSNRHAKSSSTDTLAAVTAKRSKGDPYNAEPRTG